MKKRLLNLATLLIALLALSVNAQTEVRAMTDVSPLTLSYLNQLGQHPSGLVPGYIYKTKDNQKYYISAFVKINSQLDEDLIKKMDIIVGTKLEGVATFHIPLAKFKEALHLPGIDYLELDQPAFPTIDSARRQARVDSVHRGLGLPMAYSGKDVLVGIVDQGFDYNHPQFKDSTGKKYRIIRVWEENTIGQTYAGGTYGTEFRDIDALLAHGSDSKIHTHGTHVAGIATGSGIGGDTTGKLWRGMSYASDVIIVGIGPSENAWISTGLTNMIDGINYCFQIAESMGKPIVVNLSWGSTLGPHDGTSLFSQACDKLTGKRKLFVCSAGNSGDDQIHLGKTFTTKDTVLNTFVTFASGLPYKKNRVDAWGDVGQKFCASIALHNGTKKVAFTKTYCMDGKQHIDTLIGTNLDTCFVKITCKVESFNNKPRVLVELYNKTKENIQYTINGTPGTVNMWQGFIYNSSGYYGTFSNGGFPWATAGDNKMTISDQSSTKSAIAVGSYNSKVKYKSYFGVVTDYSQFITVAQRSDFSSRGPTADNRIKPDICGPGSLLASGISSFDPSYKKGGSNYNSVVKMYVDPITNDTNYYGMAQGTSMSSPAVAGIIGLMLEVNPDLDPEMVRNILDRTAIEDKYTFNIPDAGNNNWGQGKVNAMGAIRMTQALYNPKPIGTIKVFPNPITNPSIPLTVFYQNDKIEEIEFMFCDFTGRVFYKQKNMLHAGENWISIPMTTIAPRSNISILKWKTASKSGIVKLIF